MTKPVFFCDIDGVLAPFGPNSDVTVEVVNIRPFIDVAYRPDTIKALIDLQNSGLVEFRWLTSWMESARNDFAPALGIGDFMAYADRGPLDEFSHLWWKEAVIRRHCRDEPGRWFIWADDDMDDDERNMFLADGSPYVPSEQVGLDHPHGLLLCPPIRVGLSVGDIERIEAYTRQQ